jgi:hypothetical protein
MGQGARLFSHEQIHQDGIRRGFSTPDGLGLTPRPHIEIGYEPYTNSFIRVLDEGGDTWKGRSSYKSVEAALSHAEKEAAPLIRDKCRLD